MHLVISGGTGFIGRSAANQLREAGYTCTLIGRSEPRNLDGHRFVRWDGRTVGDWAHSLEGAAAIINLAGRTVDCVKTPDNVDQILRSRIESTAAVGRALAGLTTPPPVWVQMSTAHRYGDSPEVTCTEDSPFGYGLAPFVGEAWERTFEEHLPAGMRGVVLRTSFVVGRNGGALASLLRITRLGLGGTVGSGRQGMSWIHEFDMNAIIQRAVENEAMRGAYIVSAPEPVDNRTFMRTLRRAAGVPIGLPAPAPLVRLGARYVLRTDPELALYGRYVIPARLLAEGYQFQFLNLGAALADLV